jgi:exodeoxyribonuclease V alpha subunit
VSKPIKLDPDQADAVYVLCYEPCGVITGGPGRGKTRTLEVALPDMGNVALCAPSGKAARRMGEITNHPASTVHRLLGLQPDTEYCEFHRGNPLPYDAVVVDEASTLDNWLCAKLVEAIDPKRTKLFLIGDVDQLPSVGAGQVLYDLIESDVVPVVELKTMHRAAAESWVCRMAPEILEGRIDLTPGNNFLFVDADEDLVDKVLEQTLRLMSIHGDRVQVVAPTNVGECGTSVLNPALQAVINPKHPTAACFGGKTRIHEDDEVVVVLNDYEHSVFNGETGRVLRVDNHPDGAVTVDFYDRKVTFKKTKATELLRLSYALTVHKMQGSEVEWIVLALHDSHGQALTRKLLYTAVTRAKTGVVIVGQRSAIDRALNAHDQESRYTRLATRLRTTSGRFGSMRTGVPRETLRHGGES